MGAVWGNNIKLTIFGESHGKAVGITLDGLPAGLLLDFEFIQSEMKRRAPGNSPLSTPRSESDIPEIISGLYCGRTTGSPLTALIKNENTKPGDYNPDLMRPGHADLTAFYKFGGFADMRGSGHFSGRLTAPLVFAGAVAKQILSQKGIKIGARIFSIGEIFDQKICAEEIIETSQKSFPSFSKEEEMQNAILKAKKAEDSVGGIVECAATGLPKGRGSPFFDSLESNLAHLIFSVPAVKGLEFGGGFSLASMCGSQANDCMEINKENEIIHKTNHNGGIIGGITNGEPLIFRVAIKPTPSIGIEQESINIKTMQNVKISTSGRHDPCIVPRAIVVIEAVTAICLLDLV